MPARVAIARWRRGMTLVELLVVIAVIGVLVALLLPAVQAAREAARNTQCKSQLKQIALAMLNFETTHRELPAGGWNASWIGDPNHGVGRRQPGGWVFQTAPYLEQRTGAFPGIGVEGLAIRDALAGVARVTLPVMNCPSRRPAGLYPALQDFGFNFETFTEAAKTDYAANAGTRMQIRSGAQGPWIASPFVGSACRGYPNCKWASDDAWLRERWNGVVGDHTGARVAQITDGASRTLLVAEKWVHDLYYDLVSVDSAYDNQTNGNPHDNPGDNGSMYVGFDYDNVRIASESDPPVRDREYDLSDPQVDKKGNHYKDRFGGAHPAGLNLARCDGSVRGLAYGVDPKVWAALGSRRDGQTVEPSD